MANVKEQSAALKSRQTKLLKKSKEELIEIVLKKDKIEKNQVNQISNLKGEINSLQSRIKGFVSDNEGNEKKIKELKNDNIFLKDRNDSLNEKINTKSIEIEELTDKFNKIIAEKEFKAKSWANIAITLGITLIIASIMSFIDYICK